MNGMTKATKLGWLVRREFWEHKGGLMWAPLIAGLVHLLLTAVALGFATVHAGDGMSVPLATLMEGASVKHPEALQAAVMMLVFSVAAVLFITQTFVVFAYCLSALHDERKTRQALFWKSLPVSDRMTVASKAITALVVAPLLTLVFIVAHSLLLLLLLSGYGLSQGVDVWTALWAHGGLFSAWSVLVASLPVHVLWALPAVGWWLFWSAAARRFPFLWGALIPVGMTVMAAIVVGGSLAGSVATVMSRVAVGLVPGSWVFRMGDIQPHELTAAPILAAMSHVLTQPGVWVGAAGGLLLLVGAVIARTHREEG